MAKRLFSGVLWGAFVVLLLSIGYLFLVACDVNHPPWLGLRFCPGTAADAAPTDLRRERERAAFLRRQVEQAEISLAQMPACPPQTCVPRQVSKEEEVVVILDASLSMILPLELSPSELPHVRALETERDPNRAPDPESERIVNELLQGRHGRLTRFDGAKRDLVSIIHPLGEKKLSLVTMRGCGSSDVSHGRAGDIEGMVAPIALPARGQGTDLANSLERAAEGMRPDAQGRYNGVILMVTDGMQNCPGNLCETAERVRQRRPGVSINVIDVAGYTADLECVVRGTGRVWRVGAGGDLRSLMRQAQTFIDPASCPEANPTVPR